MNDARAGFVERMGFALEEDRLPRIAGRIMGLLLLEEAPLSLDDIASRLEVSRGSVSTNARLLQSLGVIERATVPRTRRDHYQIASEPGRKLLRVTADQMRGRSQMIQTARRALTKPSPTVKRRLLGLERFYRVVGQSIEQAITELDAG